MTDKGHFAALQEIRSWNTNDVICALKNNGLADCTEAVKKREITGDKLLELSEMTLGLWKRDLPLQNIRKLATFVQDISKSPAKFVCSASSYSDDAWDTDFDDDSEEENHHHKSGNGVSCKGNLDRSGQRSANNGVSSKEKMISEVKTSLLTNTSVSNFQPPKLNKSNSYYSRRKINIPSVFASEKTSNNKIHELSASTTKLSSLKAEFAQNKKGENVKPSIPSRPTSLYLKPPMPETSSLTLPKPPEFNKEGSILKEICEKFKSQTDMNNEDYESIHDEFPLTRAASNNKINSNGFGISHFSTLQKSESPSRSHLHGSDSKLPTPHTPDSDPENLKSIASSMLENKNTLHNILSVAQPTKCLSKQEEPKNSHLVNQEFPFDSSRLSPVPLPPRNDIKRDPSPVSRIQNNSPKDVQWENGDVPSPEHLRIQEKLLAAKNDENLNIHTDEVYEIIPEDVRSCSSKSDDNEGPFPMKGSSPAPTLPPKPKNALGNTKSSSKTTKPETNATSSSFWSFGSQKEKGQAKEKATQKNNTLPRPPNSYVNDVQRTSATRPLPPPPLEGGIQRPIKVPLIQMPWYFNIDRKKAEEILRNCEDGMFVIRPSTQTQNPWTLTLKYGSRSFNICVRHRPDGRYALGTAKATEQTFSSVEELVKHYSCNELLLYSNGSQAGTIRLTSPPRKEQLSTSLVQSS